MAREAVKHLNITVCQYRKLSGRKRGRVVGGSNRPDQGPPCAYIPKQCLVESRLDEGHRANLGRQRQHIVNNECNRRTGIG
eukprot:5665679-Pyramimonas_sp.AAC.2